MTEKGGVVRHGVIGAMGLMLATGTLLGCSAEHEAPPGEELDARVVMLENDPALPLTPPAVSTRPVDPGLMAGWVAAESDDGGPEDPRNPNGHEIPEAEDGKSYVFVTTGTSCLPVEDATLRRDGDALEVAVDVPDEQVDCAVPNHAHIQFAVDSSLVEGVTTVNGEVIAAATGPAEAVAEVTVGTLFDDRRELSTVRPVELVSTGDAEPILTALADAAGADDLEKAETALTAPPPDGMRRFAFLLQGCPGDETVLVVAPGVVSAERIGPGQSGCPEAEQFLVSVFDVPADAVTSDTEPALYRQT